MRIKLLAMPLLFLFMACGGGSKQNNPVPVANPDKATLTLPAQNAVCTTGTIISTAQSSITFSWNAANNASSYDLYIKNLLTLVTATQSTEETKLTVTLSRNTPYSWYIVSKSNKTTSTAQSDTWKFYNSGPGVITYAPFPATLTSPTFGQDVTATAGNVNLTWTGTAVDNSSITNYDVYFGTTTSPALFKSAVTDSFLNGVSVTSGTTYYWKVVTRDTNGNTSDSDVYQFNVN